MLGTTGVRVSSICLGTAFRGRARKRRTDADCAATIERAFELGINFLDCANTYSGGWSEELIGSSVKRLGIRDTMVITTKVGMGGEEPPIQRGLSRMNILLEIERSLRRLQTDYVDLYMIHLPDLTTPLDETLRAMDSVVRQGKARYVGVSNHRAHEVVELLWAADRGNIASPAVLEYQYSLMQRWEIERQIVPLCHSHGLGLVTYSPLAIGLLTGQIRRSQAIPPENYWYERKGSDRVLERAEPVVEALDVVARDLGKTPSQVALAWILANSAVSAPIVGPDLPEQLDELVGAVGWNIPEESKTALDEASAGGGPFEMVDTTRRAFRRRGSRLDTP